MNAPPRSQYVAPNAASELSPLAMPPLASSAAARAVLPALCLTHDGLARHSTTRTRLLSIHLNDRLTTSRHSPAPRFATQSDRPSVRPSNLAGNAFLDTKREVTTCSGNQHEEKRHRHAMSALLHDGVVRFDRHWGVAHLLLEQPIASVRGRIVAHDAHTLDSGEQEGSETIGETIAGWISRRLDQVAREQHTDGRHCLRYDGEIPGIAPVVRAVEATFGQLARDYLGNDTFLSHYSTFRLPSNLDLANCSYRQLSWRARCYARNVDVPVALPPSAATHTVSDS